MTGLIRQIYHCKDANVMRLPIFSGTQGGTMACVSYRGYYEKSRVISEAPSSGCRARRRITPLPRRTKKASLVRQIQPLAIPQLFPPSLHFPMLHLPFPPFYLPFTFLLTTTPFPTGRPYTVHIQPAPRVLSSPSPSQRETFASFSHIEDKGIRLISRSVGSLSSTHRVPNRRGEIKKTGEVKS